MVFYVYKYHIVVKLRTWRRVVYRYFC